MKAGQCLCLSCEVKSKLALRVYEDCVLRGQDGGLAKQPVSFLHPTFVLGKHSEQVDSLGIAWILLEDLPAELSRRGTVP